MYSGVREAVREPLHLHATNRRDPPHRPVVPRLAQHEQHAVGEDHTEWALRIAHSFCPVPRPGPISDALEAVVDRLSSLGRK